MKQTDIEALEASGLKPIVIDENFDWKQIHGVFEPPLSKIDWKLLRRQKRWLVDLAPTLGQSGGLYATGIVHLLDHIQDNAVATGQATELEVFGPKADE